jgi:hypothetical protein
MIYTEDEDNVRPSWMPYHNDYRRLDVDELATIEDCDEAIIWLQNIAVDLHTKLAANPDSASIYKMHLSRCHALRSEINLKRSEWLREERVAQKVDAAKRHAQHLAEQAEISRVATERKAKMKAENIAKANDRSRRVLLHFKKLIQANYGEVLSEKLFMRLITEAGERADAEIEAGLLEVK